MVLHNPRKASVFDKDRRDARRQVEQVRQGDHTVWLLQELLAAQRETNRILAYMVHTQTGRPMPPPPPSDAV